MIPAKSKLKHVYNAPGTATYTGNRPLDGLEIERIAYGETDAQRASIRPEQMDEGTGHAVTWINVCGLTQAEQIQSLLDKQGIGKMTIEDVLHIGQRPKVDFYDNYVYVVLMMLTYDHGKKDVQYEQVSFILSDDRVITLQEEVGDVFESVRARIFQEKSAIRRKSADYLLYTLLDAIVDHYFVLLNVLEDQVEAFESTVINHPRALKLRELYHLRKRIAHIKITIEPMKEVISELIREDSIIEDSVKKYLRDVQDHLKQIVDYTLTYRDMLNNILDIYLSFNSHRMNQIMTTLTLFSAIFIPITFLAGVYGMNFKYLPELGWKYGYLGFWGVSLAIAVSMLLFFRGKKWI